MRATRLVSFGCALDRVRGDITIRSTGFMAVITSSSFWLRSPAFLSTARSLSSRRTHRSPDGNTLKADASIQSTRASPGLALRARRWMRCFARLIRPGSLLIFVAIARASRRERASCSSCDLRFDQVAGRRIERTKSRPECGRVENWPELLHGARCSRGNSWGKWRRLLMWYQYGLCERGDAENLEFVGIATW